MFRFNLSYDRKINLKIHFGCLDGCLENVKILSL